MRYIIRKAIACIVVFSFVVSNTVYAYDKDNYALRSMALNHTHTEKSMISSLLKLPPDMSITDIKTSSSGAVAPEDIFERRLAFAMIKPSIATESDKNLLSEDAIIDKLKDLGFEVIAVLPEQILSRKDAEEFYAEYKVKPFFDTFIEHMISSSTIPVILRGPRNAWQSLNDILGPIDGSSPKSLRSKMSIGIRQLPDGKNIVYNRIYASDSFESTLKNILFFANRQEDISYLGSGEKLLMSLSLESDRAYFSALYRQYKLQLLVSEKARILMKADITLSNNDAYAKATALVMHELKEAGKDKDALILSDSKPLIIGSNFFPSALLSDKDFKDKLGAVQYNDLADDSRNTQAASNVTMVQNPLNGGIGQAMDRLDFLKTIWKMTGRKSEPKLGAKAMDCYFKAIVKINEQEKEAFVSVAEATILALLYGVENGHYSQGILEEFISSETRQAMDDLMDTVYLYDRLDTSNSSKRTYGEILEEKNMLGIMPEQALFPRFDVEDNNKLTDKYTAPGSHGHWGVYALSNMPDKKLPQDGSVQIRSIFNGDGISNSPNNVIAGWMARESVPVVMITTTRASIDVKGGMLGVEYLAGKKSRKNLLELADAKTNDKKNPGQAELFKNMGTSKTDGRFGKDGMQLFNTNTVLLNDTVLQPFLRDLRAMLGLEEYNRVISPKMMMKSVKQKDGKEYVQLEGAMGSSMLGLAGFLSTTDDAKIKELCKEYAIDPSQFLRIVNIDVNERTDFFAPIKFPIDYWLQFFSDHFAVDTITWKLKNLRPGHLPALDTPDQDKDEYYSNVLNLFNLFGDKGVLNKDNPVMTSTIGLDLLRLRGKVKLAGSILRGDVIVINDGEDVADLTTGKIREKLLADNLAGLDNGRLVLEDIAIVISDNGNELKAIRKEDVDDVIVKMAAHKASSSGLGQAKVGKIYRDKKLPYMFVEDYDALSEMITDIACDLIRRKPNAIILVPGCNTPIGFYKKLATKAIEGSLDISRVRFVTLDSPIDLGLTDPRNFKMYMYQYFYRYLYGDIPSDVDREQYIREFYIEHDNLIVPYVPQDITLAEAEKAATEYGEMLKNLGYADLAFLGLGQAKKGNNGKLIGGHIAFNEPGSAINSRARIVDLAEHTVDVKFRDKGELWVENDLMFNIPDRAITLGVHELLQSKQIILAASGANKSQEVKYLLEGDIDSNFPATYLYTVKEKTIVIADTKASSLIKTSSSGKMISPIKSLLEQQMEVEFVDKNLLADISYRSKGRFMMQVNPAREPKNRAVVSKTIKSNNGPAPCFLCVENMPEQERGIKLNSDFTVYANPRPIDEGHIVVVANKHEEQFITKSSGVMEAINLLSDTAPYALFFNGKGAAASGDHFHFQALNLRELNNRLPVESSKLEKVLSTRGVTISTLRNYPASCLAFEGKDATELANQVSGFLESLNSGKIPYNILFTRTEDSAARIFIFPRAVENPHSINPRFLDIKFGTLEMAGLFIVYSDAMVDNIEEKALTESLKAVSLDSVVFEQIVSDAIKSSSSGLNKSELKDIYNAQAAKNWRVVQDAQLQLKEAFLAGYADNWQKVKEEYPGLKPVFNPQNSDRQGIVFTPEMARGFNITPRDKNTQEPTGHFKEFYDKSDNSTAGVRAFYDPLHSENPNVMYNEAFMAILVKAEAEFLSDVHKELATHLPGKGTKDFIDFIKALRRDIPAENIAAIERIYGMDLEDIIPFLKHNIVKLVGGEVRAHSAKFVEMETRILAENGVTVLTAPNYSDSVPIYMFSFLTYLLGASGATNNTPSHSSNYIFGRKALAPDGSQLLPDLYERYRNIIDDIIENRIYGNNDAPYEITISSASDSHIRKTLSYDDMIKLYKSILNITPEEIALINEATKKGHRIVLNCLNGSTWKTLKVLLRELGIDPEVFDLVMEEEDPYFNVGYIVTRSDDGTYSIDHLGVDTTMTMVANTIPYASFLDGYPSGTRQYELDPDSDRFVLKQVLDKTDETMRLVNEYGIDFYELDDNKILIAPSPNKVFLNLDIADYERMVEAGTWEQFHSLYMITYVSSRAWSEFADAVDGLIRVMHRVGFKNLNEVQAVLQQWYDNKTPFNKIKDANDFIKDITYDEIVFNDQLGRTISIDRSKRIRIHAKEEESGGRVAGMNKPSYNILGQSTLAMPEKSAADSLFSELIHSSRLFLENPDNYSFLKFNDYAFKKFGLRSKIDARLDILHGDQGTIAKMSFKDKEKALGDALLNKANFNNFFFSMGNAVKRNEISLEEAIEIFNAVLPKYADTWNGLDEITLAEETLSGGRTRPEGAPLIFKGKDGEVVMVTEFDFRPSGTDPLKSKIYYDAEIAPNKQDIENYFMALTQYNLYEVLEDYGIESVLAKPDNISEIGLKSLVLGQGPAIKASSSGKSSSIAVKKLLDQLKDEDMLGQMRFVAGLDEVLTPAEMAGYRVAYSNNKFLDIGFDYKKDKKTNQITTYLNRLGWTTDAIARVLDNPKVLADIIIKAAEIRERYDYVIFCGMGGSRLCIDTVRGVFGEPKDIKMFTLGTTDSSTIDDIVTAISEDAGSLQEALKKTLVVAISKSATTKETLSHKQYFEDLFISSELFGENPLNPDDHLLFITDKDAALYKQATPENRQDRMMLIQLDQKTDMGGRYTAPATTIPLLPLAIIAGDKAPELITTILKKAFEMNDISDINKDRFIELGAFLYYMAAIEHKDKLTLILPEDLKALAPWSEQLFEESLGKHIEKGITIIYNEDISSDNIKSLPENDRVFLRFKFLDQTDSQEGFWKHLVENGYPVRQIEVDNISSLGGIELGLQRAVATIGYLWDINFVDQPAVDGYKKATNEVMDALAPNAHVTIPFTTEAKYQSLKLYWQPLVDADAINEEQLRAEVKELGSDITDAPAVYAAIIRLLIENQGFEVAELAPWANMTSSFEKVMKQVRYDIFTAGLKMPSKLAIHPDGNHSFQQNVEGGRNIFFSTYMLGMKMRQPKVQEYEPELLKAQAIGTVNSLVDSNRKVVLLVTDNELVLEERVVEGFFDKVEQYLAKTSSSGESRLAPEKRLAIEAQFNDLLEFTEESDIEGAIKRPIVKFDLTRDDFLSFDFAMILEHFRQLARDKLGENIIMDILPNMNGHEGVRVGISMQSYSVMVANKTSSSGILLTDNDLVLIELAAEIADLSDATGTIVYNDTTIPTEQQRILWSLLGKGTQGLADLEVKLGCNVRLMSQGDVLDDVNTIIISTEQLPGFYNAKYLITKQAQIDTSYIAIVPLIGIAKGLLGFESRTSQPELYEALKSSIRRLSKGQLNDSAIEAAITAYINDKLISIMLPLPTSYDYEKLEQLYRQALMVLIAA